MKPFELSVAVEPHFVADQSNPAKQQFVEKKTQTALPQERKAATVEIPQIPFTDITTEAGIDYTHYDGKQGERLLPETMGGGSGFFDYDNDSDQDILFVNSCDWPWSKRSVLPCYWLAQRGESPEHWARLQSEQSAPNRSMGCKAVFHTKWG